MGFNYKILKLRVKLRKNKNDNFEYLDDVQKKACEIVIQMINDKDSELFFDPQNIRRGIKNKDIFVEIKNNKIRIANSISHDDVSIDDKTKENLIIRFNQKMMKRFDSIENKFINKAKKRLDFIKKEIENK